MTEKRNLFSSLKNGYRGMKDDLNKQEVSEITRKKRRFMLIVIFGLIMSVVAFLISISISSGGVIPVSEAVSALFSSIGKAFNNDNNLNMIELYIYNARLPRTIAAIAVGAGLAVAGCMYQAIIRNPLVDPYITGVSSGAGCLAMAATALGFSIPFLADNTLYIIPVVAIIGGIVAFFITMTVAEGSGGSSINYILAGTIVGFAFSSVQTIFMSMGKDNLTDVMWWLYGSFANITWENAWIIFIPAMGIAIVAMIWARELGQRIQPVFHGGGSSSPTGPQRKKIQETYHDCRVHSDRIMRSFRRHHWFCRPGSPPCLPHGAWQRPQIDYASVRGHRSNADAVCRFGCENGNVSRGTSCRRDYRHNRNAGFRIHVNEKGAQL